MRSQYLLKHNKEKDTYHIHFKTEIYDDLEDENFMDTLKRMDITVLETKGSKLIVGLPDRWITTDIDKRTRIIADQYGRIRIRVDLNMKTTTLCKRFHLEVVIVESMDTECPALGVQYRILEGDTIVREEDVTGSELELLKFPDMDSLLSHFYQDGKNFISFEFPDYNDPVAYW